MAAEDDLDLMLVTEQIDDLEITRAAAMEALDSALRKMQTALEKSAGRYHDLYSKYLDLKETVANKATYVSGQVEDDEGYVVAIIDAHSHNFMQPFLKGASDSGAAAAKRVEEIIVEIIRREHPELAGLRVLIRVYADVQLLISQLEGGEGDRLGLSGSFELFIQSFSTWSPFSDFINVAHEGLAEKMMGVLQWHMRVSQCKHVLYNIAEDSSIHNIIAADYEHKGRITDVPEALARILPGYVAAKTASPSLSTSNIDLSASDGKVASGNGEEPHRRKPYGYLKINRYVPVVPLDSHMEASGPSMRQNESTSQHPNAPPAQAERIPINAAGHRLDPPLRMPSSGEHVDFNSRTKSKRFCTPFHLAGYCYNKDCRYDHGHIDPAQLHVLRHKLLGWPCHNKGQCRRKDCYHGHMCVAARCRSRKHRGCRFGSEAHIVDKEVHEWVMPGARQDEHSAGLSDNESVPPVVMSKGSMENWPTMVTDLIEI